MTSFSLKLSAIGIALGLAAFAVAPASALPALGAAVPTISGDTQVQQVKMMHHKMGHKKMHKKMMRKMMHKKMYKKM